MAVACIFRAYLYISLCMYRNEASECMIIEVNVKGVRSCRLDRGK